MGGNESFAAPAASADAGSVKSAHPQMSIAPSKPKSQRCIRAPFLPAARIPEAVGTPLLQDSLPHRLWEHAVEGSPDWHLPLAGPGGRPGTIESHGRSPLGEALVLAVAGGEGIRAALVVDHVDPPSGMALGGEGVHHRCHVERVDVRFDHEDLREKSPARGENLDDLAAHFRAAAGHGYHGSVDGGFRWHVDVHRLNP